MSFPFLNRLTYPPGFGCRTKCLSSSTKCPYKFYSHFNGAGWTLRRYSNEISLRVNEMMHKNQKLKPKSRNLITYWCLFFWIVRLINSLYTSVQNRVDWLLIYRYVEVSDVCVCIGMRDGLITVEFVVIVTRLWLRNGHPQINSTRPYLEAVSRELGERVR